MITYRRTVFCVIYVRTSSQFGVDEVGLVKADGKLFKGFSNSSDEGLDNLGLGELAVSSHSLGFIVEFTEAVGEVGNALRTF